MGEDKVPSMKEIMEKAFGPNPSQDQMLEFMWDGLMAIKSAVRDVEKNIKLLCRYLKVRIVLEKDGGTYISDTISGLL